MRLFVAADVSEETRTQIARVRGQIERHMSARHAPRVTWVKAEIAHVTLRFIGELAEERMREVADALGGGFALPPFDLVFDRLGTFPSGRFPRIIWLGASAGAAALTELAQHIGVRLDRLIGPGETREFKAHVTLARVRDPGRHFSWSRTLSEVKLESTTSHVDHVTLYSSQLSPKGPTYTALCRAPLGTLE